MRFCFFWMRRDAACLCQRPYHVLPKPILRVVGTLARGHVAIGRRLLFAYKAHRLANPGSMPLELIEVLVGSYLGEDDIVRLTDQYSRH